MGQNTSYECTAFLDFTDILSVNPNKIKIAIFESKYYMESLECVKQEITVIVQLN